MAFSDPLEKIYSELIPDGPVHLFVIPLIRFEYKKSDYLYLFYKSILSRKKNRFTVHSTSIWQHWKFVWQAFRGRPVIVHYHWLECQDFKAMAGMVYKILCLCLFKQFNGKLVWTIHNKKPHDGRFEKLNYFIRSRMARQADLLHVHCQSAIADLSDYFSVSESKFRVIGHPSFPAKKIDRDKARKQINQKRKLALQAKDQIFLMFGNISSYKGMIHICKIFAGLPDHRKLLIVGPVKKGQISYYQKLKTLSKNHFNIIIIPHFIAERDVPRYFNMCDCVLFNYNRILTSGGVELARSYNKPIIAPNLGCLSELSGENVHLFSSQEQLAELIIHFPSPEKPDE